MECTSFMIVSPKLKETNDAISVNCWEAAIIGATASDNPARPIPAKAAAAQDRELKKAQEIRKSLPCSYGRSPFKIQAFSSIFTNQYRIAAFREDARLRASVVALGDCWGSGAGADCSSVPRLQDYQKASHRKWLAFAI